MSETPQPESGPFATLPRMLRTLRQMAESRGELFLLELREERLRLFDTMLLMGAWVACATVAVGLLITTLVMACGPEHRLTVLGLLTLAFAASAAWAFLSFRRRLLRWQAFAATREQFQKDCACFKTKS
jgi:uncharacterized membrane protein YqjE